MIFELMIFLCFGGDGVVKMSIGDPHIEESRKVIIIRYGISLIESYGDKIPVLNPVPQYSDSYRVLSGEEMKSMDVAMITISAFSGDHTREVFDTSNTVVEVSNDTFVMRLMLYDLNREESWKDLRAFQNNPDAWADFRRAVFSLLRLAPSPRKSVR